MIDSHPPLLAVWVPVLFVDLLDISTNLNIWSGGRLDSFLESQSQSVPTRVRSVEVLELHVQRVQARCRLHVPRRTGCRVVPRMIDSHPHVLAVWVPFLFVHFLDISTNLIEHFGVVSERYSHQQHRCQHLQEVWQHWTQGKILLESRSRAYDKSNNNKYKQLVLVQSSPPSETAPTLSYLPQTPSTIEALWCNPDVQQKGWIMIWEE